MSIATDRRIREMVAQYNMIEPFEDRMIRNLSQNNSHITYRMVEGTPIGKFNYELDDQPVISYGLSSFGYDIRVADEFRIFTPSTGFLTVIDPKSMDPRAMVEYKGDVCIIPPNSFALARSVEYFRVPRHVLCLALGKSTYARIGIICNLTPFEPEWEGHVTIEISNTTPLPCKVYANEGICQVLFFENEEPEISYADRKGKYMKQVGVTPARV